MAYLMLKNVMPYIRCSVGCPASRTGTVGTCNIYAFHIYTQVTYMCVYVNYNVHVHILV